MPPAAGSSVSPVTMNLQPLPPLDIGFRHHRDAALRRNLGPTSYRHSRSAA
jgi:hypothetical protein